MRGLEAVIFDCDGVLVDSDALQVQAQKETATTLVEQHGLDIDLSNIDWDEMQGWGRVKIAAKLFSVDLKSELADQYRIDTIATTVRIACEENLFMIPNAENFVKYMVLRGLKVGVATSSHRDAYMAYWSVHPLDLFPPGYIVTHGEALDNKPQAGPYREVMKRMDVEPSRTLVVEDSGSGITAGRSAGAFVLGLATTKSPEYLRTKTGAHLVAEDFKDATRQLQPYLPS